MVFSTNQVRQLFVVKAIKDPANPGDVRAVAITGIGGDSTKPAHFFKTINPQGDWVKSDYIITPQTRHINITAAADLRINLPHKALVNTVTPNDGDVFYVNFTFPAYISLTNEEDMTKTVAMRYNYRDNGTLYVATGGTGFNADDDQYLGVDLKDNWAAQMAKALDLAFNARQNMDNTLLYFGFDPNGSNVNTVDIIAKEPKWRRGVMECRPNDFILSNLTYEDMSNAALSTLPLENNSRIKVYGTQQDLIGQAAANGFKFTSDANFVPPYYINDGATIADLEYFCMGERGDNYRMKGWPNVIYTDYLVDPTAEYDVVDIHHYYQGEGTNDDKSEKVTTLVFEMPNSGSGKSGGMKKSSNNHTSLLDSVFSAQGDKVEAFWELMTAGTAPSN